MNHQNQDALRNELLWLLEGGNAHVNFDQAVAKIPKKYFGAPVEGLPYTLWRILQHMKISQKDILEYIKNPHYQELVWPDDYWPQEKSPPSTKAWSECLAQIRKNLEEIKELVRDPKTNLFATLPYVKEGPSILHEILLVVDHNSYHIGQIVLLRGMLGIWKD